VRFPVARAYGFAIAIGVVVFVAGCRDDATAPGPQLLNVAGSWAGSENDRLGPAFLTWQIVQAGSELSGTATIRPVDAADGSCASCHKNKIGTVSGSVSGQTITISMFFPAGVNGDPTPACSIRLDSSVPTATASAIAGTYSGSDPCEGTFEGTLMMTRKP
jgi:hypothetical protein